MSRKINWFGRVMSLILTFALTFTTIFSGFGRNVLASSQNTTPNNSGNQMMHPQGRTFTHFDIDPVGEYKLYQGDKVIATVNTTIDSFRGDKVVVTAEYGDGTPVNFNIKNRGLVRTTYGSGWNMGTHIEYRMEGNFYAGSESDPVYYTLTYPVTFKVNGKDYTVNFFQTLTLFSKENRCTSTGVNKGIDFEVNHTNAISEYNVTFVNEGKEVKTEKVAQGGYATAPVVSKDSTEYADYVFDKWVDASGKEVSIKNITADMTVYASYKENVKEYKITFLYADGTTYKVVRCAYGDIITVPDVPEKADSTLYKYENGVWAPTVVTTCAGNATYKASYTETKKTYEISYVVIGETVSKTFEAGTSADEVKNSAPEVPTSYSDEQNTYAFSKWDKTFSPVTDDVTYTAVYDKAPNEYTVEFLNASGNSISKKTYTYGQKITVPSTPKYDGADDIYYSHNFTGWDKAVSETCTGNATYTAKYDSVIKISYYQFLEKVDNKEKLFDRTYIESRGTNYFKKVGSTVTITITDENKAQYSALIKALGEAYKKNQGDKVYGTNDETVINKIVANSVTYAGISANAVDIWYVAKVEDDGWHIDGAFLQDYTVKFVDSDNSIISEKKYKAGEKIEVPDYPTKAADNTYTYVCIGWDKEVSETAKQDVVYKAVYDKTFIDYTIRFFDEDGSEISNKTYHYGEQVNVPTTPNKAADNVCTYEFSGWNKEVTVVVADADYTATYESTYIEYTVEFVSDGKTISSKTYHYGNEVEIPTAPRKASNESYTYEFKGWDKEITLVEKDITYYAVFESSDVDYTVKFVDYDGELISSETYHYGDIVKVPTNPEREADKIYTYKFAGWDKEVVSVSGDITYTATYEKEYVEYIVKFYNYNNSLLSEKTYHYGEKVEEPKDVFRYADETYTYEFKGWDKKVVEVTEDAEYTATYEATYIEYTVIFNDYDKEEISSKKYHYGDTVIVPVDPERAADNTYTYEFAGWDKEVTEVTESIVYTATYEPTYIEYTVEFVDEDGSEISSETYHYGDTVNVPAAPSKEADDEFTYFFAGWDKNVTPVTENTKYTATYSNEYIEYTVTFISENETLSQKTYHYGDEVEVPADPEKAADETYTYEFAGWDKDVTEVTGDATYYAVFSSDAIDYEIIFVDDNEEVISREFYHYGDTVRVPADPSKEADETYTYEFSGWDKEIVAVEGNATYTATYEANYIEYTVNFINEGEVISTKTYHFGDEVEVPADPEKEADNTFTYEFAGWDKEIVAVKGDADYYATYNEAYIEYTVRFEDENGSVISEKTYHYGDKVEVPADPEKEADETYTYEFSGWDKEVVEVVADEVYTATYTSDYIEYTVEFVDYDGTEISSVTYHYGDEVVVPANPERNADETYTYEFSGWDKEIVAVEGNAIYTAEYEATYIEYTVEFVDYDGTSISKETYHYGDEVVVPADPTREADKEYTYEFAGWDKDVVAVVENATYKATYASSGVDYVVEFIDEDKTLISREIYHYGDTVNVPADPTKAADETYTYEFAGWDKEVVAVVENAVYMATYTSEYIEYMINFVDADGKELSSKNYHHGDKVIAPKNPTKAADSTYTYEFAGWDKQIVDVVKDETYKATYNKNYIEYTVIFEDYDGKEISKATYHYGDSVRVPVNPEREADETYTYEFSGWDKEIVTVTKDAVYTATYEAAYIEYTVIFENYDGKIISSATYHYGDTVNVPANPEREADKEYTYEFFAWNKDITTVVKDEVYTATYTSSGIDYIIEFVNDDASLISREIYHYGDTVRVPANPTKSADNTYTYEFAGWDKEIVVVEDNATYTATYTSEYIDYTVEFVDYDGTSISKATYHYGDVVEVPANPKREADEAYTYEFAGWDKEIVAVEENATYEATYEATYVEYEVEFVDYDGTSISKATYHYGDVVEVPANPEREADKEYTYEFAGWDKEIVEVVENAVYKATYTSSGVDYVIEFIDEDNTLISREIYHYGDTVVVPENPTKAADESYTYEFAGWDKEVVEVVENAVYQATYDKKEIVKEREPEVEGDDDDIPEDEKPTVPDRKPEVEADEDDVETGDRNIGMYIALLSLGLMTVTTILSGKKKEQND